MIPRRWIGRERVPVLAVARAPLGCWLRIVASEATRGSTVEPEGFHCGEIPARSSGYLHR